MKIRSGRIRQRELEGAEDIAAAIAEAAQVEEGFAVLESDDGSFVQYDGARLERGANGRIWRLDVDRAAYEAFVAFAEGRPPPESLAWREITDALYAEARARRDGLKRSVLFLLVIGLFVAAIFGIGHLLMERAGGG